MPTVLTTPGQNGPEAIATDGKNVYWNNFQNGTVNQIAVSAPTNTIPTVLASGQNSLAGSTGITTDGINVYWTTQGSGTTSATLGQIAVSAPTCNQPTILNSELHGSFDALATDGKNIYWLADFLTGNQLAIGAPASTMPTVLASGNTSDIATDGKNVYWTGGGATDGTVSQIAVSAPSGTKPIVLASNPKFSQVQSPPMARMSIGLMLAVAPMGRSARLPSALLLGLCQPSSPPIKTV